MHICKNCNNQFEGNYCNNCSQHHETERITWKELAHHIPHAIFHVDKGLFFSIAELARRPGHILREYLQGKRVKHFNPFLMVILLGGICSILYAYFHFRMIAASVRFNELDEQSPFIAHKYYAIVVVVVCLWMAMGDFILFRKWKYTFPELLVVNIYICAELLILLLLYIPVFLIGRLFDINEFLRFFFLALLFFYTYWARVQFFNAKGNPKLKIRILLAVISYVIVLYFLVHSIVGTVFSAATKAG